MEMSEDDADELVEFWTLLDEDRGMLVGKRGAVALGFALLLKFYSWRGPFSAWPGGSIGCGGRLRRPAG